LDATGGLTGVMVVDVGDGDNLDVRLAEERIQELVSPAPRSDQAEPDLLLCRGSPGYRRAAEQGRRAGSISHDFCKPSPRDRIGRHVSSPFAAESPLMVPPPSFNAWFRTV
jgi:hypothetical protein